MRIFKAAVDLFQYQLTHI